MPASVVQVEPGVLGVAAGDVAILGSHREAVLGVVGAWLLIDALLSRDCEVGVVEGH